MTPPPKEPRRVSREEFIERMPDEPSAGPGAPETIEPRAREEPDDGRPRPDADGHEDDA
jgi:hypothetical protein